jgi:hypothetical protein
MLGEQVGLQDRLFYEFDLEDRVPTDHFLRKIDAVLDLSWLRAEPSRAEPSRAFSLVQSHGLSFG